MEVKTFFFFFFFFLENTLGFGRKFGNLRANGNGSENFFFLQCRTPYELQLYITIFIFSLKMLLWYVWIIIWIIIF